MKFKLILYLCIVKPFLSNYAKEDLGYFIHDDVTYVAIRTIIQWALEKAKEAEDKDLPKTQYEVLQKIVAKAEKEKA